MKMTIKSLVIACGVMAVQVATAAVNFPLGTQIVTGSVKNYLNELYTSENAVKVNAADTNGNIIAECSVYRAVAGSTGENYLLEIPVTSVATASSIAPGDSIRLFIVDGNTLNVAAGTVSSPKANAEIRANLRVVNVTDFDSTSIYTNALGKVSVANDYLDIWASYSDDKPYNPDGDEDGDGASNYFEYLSGTNPFDPSDKLAIIAYSLSSDQISEITFEYVGGHVYSVLSTKSLSNPSWAVEKTILPAEPESEPGATTITVVPTEASSSRFFMVNPQ